MHQMQSDQHQNIQLPLPDQVGRRYIPNPPPLGSLFGQDVNFQPSKICPRNFIIFDRTDNRSRVMYHPSVAPGFGNQNMDEPREVESVMKEDSADIDLLLSFEEEEDEEEVSTARTQGDNANDTADSCSSRPRKSRLAVSSSSHKSSGSCERKREKLRKMVNSLRGIVPGGNRMNTVAVLDEAVKYLKSLKVEMQKVIQYDE